MEEIKPTKAGSWDGTESPSAWDPLVSGLRQSWPVVMMKAQLKETAFGKLLRLMRASGANFMFLLIPVILSLVAAVFEGLGMSLLVPLLNLFIGGGGPKAGSIQLFEKLNIPVPDFISASHNRAVAFVVLLVFGAVAGKALFDALGQVLLGREIQNFLRRLRNTLFRRYLSFGKAYFDQIPSGTVWGVIMNFTFEVAAMLPHCRAGLTSFFFGIVYLVMLFSISWQLTLAALFLLPLLNFSMRRLSAWTSNAARVQATRINEMSHDVADVISAIPLVKSYTTEQRESVRFEDISQRVGDMEISVIKRHTAIGSLQEVISLAIVLCLVALASVFAGREGTGAGPEFLLFFVLVRRLAYCYTSVANARLSLLKVSGYLDQIYDLLNDEGKFVVPSGEREFHGLKKEITFNDLSFSYPGNKGVLSHVSLSFEKGTTTALVGPSGSGKTTVTSLLQRLYDSPPGSILVDGVDIREFTMESLRKRIAVVSQDTLLFNASLRSNLAYGLERELDDVELQAVLKHAALSELVAALPKGLETTIGDRGVKLSGGEKQRLSLARAMLKRAEILILDEATSALDTNTERQIQRAIERLVKKRTAILVAHRLSTIYNADKIVVIDSGRVIEQGSMKELLAKKGRFFQLYKAQSMSEPDTHKKAA